jgi:hypothetical protein
LFIEFFDLLDPVDRKWILFIAVGQGVPHQILKNIFFDQEGISLGNLQHITVVRKMLQCIEVGIELIVQTTF